MNISLVEQARAGDLDAFEALVVAGMPAVYRRALAILGSEADARDAAQETFVSAWRELRHLRDAEHWDAWLARIGLNSCRMALRHRGRVREITLGDDLLERPTADSTDSVVAADAIRRAFDRLTVDQRGLLVSHYVEGIAISQLAEVLEIPPGTVKSRLSAARAALKRALAHESALLPEAAR